MRPAISGKGCGHFVIASMTGFIELLPLSSKQPVKLDNDDAALFLISYLFLDETKKKFMIQDIDQQ